MDINKILSNTIKNLRTYPHDNVHHIGEIKIVDRQQIKSSGREATPDEIKRLVTTFNKAAKQVDNRVSFSYHQKTDRLIMRIVNPNTNEVIKQLPSKEMIKLLTNINEMLGLFIDEKR